MFWTVQHDVFGPATLCDRCALTAINAVVRERGESLPIFDAVDEALVVIEALCAVYNEPGFGVAGSEVGACENCEVNTGSVR
jgi:hypothetical protein